LFIFKKYPLLIEVYFYTIIQRKDIKNKFIETMQNQNPLSII